MTREEFAIHAARIETRFRERPTALRLRLAGLMIAGYLGLLAWPAVVLGLGALFIVPTVRWPLAQSWFFLTVGTAILLGGGAAVLRVLWVRLDRPAGETVSRTAAPELFTLLDELRAELRAAPFHRVVITAHCNAGVSEIPRLGVLGWPRHYLTLGLPLLECLSADELRAVLAHEFAHLSHRHGRVGALVYRVRRTWEGVFAKLREPYVRGEVSLRPFIVKFLDWFWPRFNAHAFLLSRANEFQADALAAQLAGPDRAASALLRIDLANRLLDEKFWPEFRAESRLHAQPPPGIFLRLRAALHAGAPPQAPAWLAQAFQFITSHADTHPCLSERLRALDRLPRGVESGVFPTWPAAPVKSAAQALLGASLDEIRTSLDAAWRREFAPAWQARHACATALHDRLQRLESAVPEPDADADALWDKASVVIRLDDDAAAAPLLAQLLALRPAHPGANFCYGRHLLATGDDAGEVHLQGAMEHDEEIVPAACELLRAYFQRTGRAERIRECQARLDRHEAALTASRDERNSVEATDTFLPHGLRADELDAILRVLATEPDIAAADLAQKQLCHFPKQRLFVLCLRLRRGPLGLPPSRDREQATIQRLLPKIQLSGRKLLFAPSGSFRPLARKLAALPEARLDLRAALTASAELHVIAAQTAG